MSSQAQYDKALIEVLFAVAWCDGSLHKEKEGPIIKREMERCRFSEVVLEHLNRYWEQAPSQEEVNQTLDFLDTAANTPQRVRNMVYLVREIVFADGIVDGREEELFEIILKELSNVDGGLKARILLKIDKKAD